jgi:hypothetical protein
MHIHSKCSVRKISKNQTHGINSGSAMVPKKICRFFTLKMGGVICQQSLKEFLVQYKTDKI